MRLRYIITLLCVVIEANLRQQFAFPSVASIKSQVIPAKDFSVNIKPLSTRQGIAYHCTVDNLPDNMKVRASWIIRDHSGSLIQTLSSVFLPADRIESDRVYFCHIISDNGVVFSQKVARLDQSSMARISSKNHPRLHSYLASQSTLKIEQIGGARFAFCDGPEGVRFADTTAWWNNNEFLMHSKSTVVPTSYFKKGVIRCAHGPLVASKNVEFAPNNFRGMPSEIIIDAAAESQFIFFESESIIDSAECISIEKSMDCHAQILSGGHSVILSISSRSIFNPNDSILRPTSGIFRINVASGKTSTSKDLAWLYPQNSNRRIMKRELAVKQTPILSQADVLELRCQETSGKDVEGQVIWISAQGKVLQRSSSPILLLSRIPQGVSEVLCLSLTSASDILPQFALAIRAGVSSFYSLYRVFEANSDDKIAWVVWNQKDVKRTIHFRSRIPIRNETHLGCYGLTSAGQPFTPNICPRFRNSKIQGASRQKNSLRHDLRSFESEIEMSPQVLQKLWQEARTNSAFDRYAPRTAQILVKNVGTGRPFWGTVPIKILRTNRAPEVSFSESDQTRSCSFFVTDPEEDHIVGKLEKSDRGAAAKSTSTIFATWANKTMPAAHQYLTGFNISAPEPNTTGQSCQLTVSDGVLITKANSNTNRRHMANLPHSNAKLILESRDSVTSHINEVTPPQLNSRHVVNLSTTILRTEHFGVYPITLDSGITPENLAFCLAPKGPCPPIQLVKDSLIIRVDAKTQSGTHLIGFTADDGSLQLTLLDLFTPLTEWKNQIVNEPLHSIQALDCRSQLELSSRGESLLSPSNVYSIRQRSTGSVRIQEFAAKTQTCADKISNTDLSKSVLWTRIDNRTYSNDDSSSGLGVEFFAPKDRANGSRYPDPMTKSGSVPENSNDTDAIASWSTVIFREFLLRSQLFDTRESLETIPDKCTLKTCKWRESNPPPEQWLAKTLEDRYGNKRLAILPLRFRFSDNLMQSLLPKALAELSTTKDPSSNARYKCVLQLPSEKLDANPEFAFWSLGKIIERKIGQKDSDNTWYAMSGASFVDRCQIIEGGNEIAQSDLNVSHDSMLRCLAVTESGWLSGIPCSFHANRSSEPIQIEHFALPSSLNEAFDPEIAHHRPSSVYAIWEDRWGAIVKSVRFDFKYIEPSNPSESYAQDVLTKAAAMISSYVQTRSFYVQSSAEDLPLAIYQRIIDISSDSGHLVEITCTAPNRHLSSCESIENMLKSLPVSKSNPLIVKQETSAPWIMVETSLGARTEVIRATPIPKTPEEERKWLWIAPVSNLDRKTNPGP